MMNILNRVSPQASCKSKFRFCIKNLRCLFACLLFLFLSEMEFESTFLNSLCSQGLHDVRSPVSLASALSVLGTCLLEDCGLPCSITACFISLREGLSLQVVLLAASSACDPPDITSCSGGMAPVAVPALHVDSGDLNQGSQPCATSALTTGH